MKRNLGIAMAIAVLFLACVMPTMSHLKAEPILGEESLNLPSDARPKEEGGSALALFRVGDYEGALKMWQELVKSHPDMPPAQTIMAQLYLKADMPKEAQNALDQAMVDAPNDPEAYLLQATVAMHDRDLTKADSLYQKAGHLISKFDQSVKRKKLLQSWLSRAMAGLAEARKDWTGAQKAFEEWSKLEPNSAAARQQVAYCLFQQKDAAGALAKLREAAKAEPAMLTPEAVLVQFCMGTGNFEEAKKWMSAASAAAPKDLKTRLALGQCALDMGDLDQAQKHSIAATKIAPKSVEAKLLRSLTALYQKDYSAAESILEGVVAESPRNVAASNNLALALVEQGDAKKSQHALELAEANAKQFPQWPQVASTYGLVLYRLGRPDDAEKALRGAASIADSDGDTVYTLARLAIDRGHKAEAKRMVQNVLKIPRSFMLRPDVEELLEQLNKPEGKGGKP